MPSAPLLPTPATMSTELSLGKDLRIWFAMPAAACSISISSVSPYSS